MKPVYTTLKGIGGQSAQDIRRLFNSGLDDCSTRNEEIMMTNDLYYMNTTLGDAMSAAKRGVTVRRIEASMSAYISPIERWADKNYAPKELVYLYHQNTDSSDIVASLRGFQPQDVHVDISHGNLIILLSDDPAYPSRPEYYCEVPLAPDVSHKDAYLEIG